MSPQLDEEQLRTWCQARVDESGSVDAARPVDDFTERAWRELCAHLDVKTKPKKARNLEEALEALRRRVAES